MNRYRTERPHTAGLERRAMIELNSDGSDPYIDGMIRLGAFGRREYEQTYSLGAVRIDRTQGRDQVPALVPARQVRDQGK